MINVLDCGYVQLIESWGSDERIIEAARMSTGKGFKGWGDLCKLCGGPAWARGQIRTDDRTDNPRPRYCSGCGPVDFESGDEKLLKRLWDKRHSSPFEMAGIVIEVQAPIFVFRQWHRHRTQSYNEHSARYSPLPDLNYVPTVERLMMASKTNKQAGIAKGAAELTEANAEIFREKLVYMYSIQQELYTLALGSGVAKELARVHLPVGRYSKMRASGNLRNMLGFLALRDHPDAQWEEQQYAKAVGTIVQQLFPRTYKLFHDSQLREYAREQEAQ